MDAPKIHPRAANVSLGGKWVVDAPLIASHFNAPRLAVRANGKPFEMIVDTGAFASLVSMELATASNADIRATKLRSVNAGGNVRPAQGIAHFNALAVGAATFYDVQAVIHDVTVLRTANEPIDGALGLSVFHDLLLTIDWPNSRLRMERGELPPVNGRDVLPLRMDERGLPLVQIKIGSRQVWALIDTGYSLGLSLPASAKSNTPLASPAVQGPPVLYYGIGQRQAEQARLAVDATIGWHVLAKPIVDLGVSNEQAILGAAYLRHFAITFDQQHGRVRFERKETAAVQTPSIMGTGYYIHPKNDTILAVTPNSGADKAGLRVGDKLLTVDGVSLATYRLVGDVPRARQDESVVTYLRSGQTRSANVRIEVLID